MGEWVNGWMGEKREERRVKSEEWMGG